jgi:cytochrome c553
MGLMAAPFPSARLITPAALLLAAAALAPARALENNPEAFFESKVRPVLVQHCVPCHGPEKSKSALRLDTGEGVYRGGSRGPAVKPGKADESLLYQAVSGKGELEMPPEEKLGAAEIEALRQWIDSGAVWPAFDPAALPSGGHFEEAARTHWAFQPIVPSAAPPVNDAAWPKNPVDQFILARMEAEGLHPAPPARRETLIRRVTMDLIGLPPTPEEVAAFLADPAPEAFSRVVDRLLASPQYGERWARHWLDLVRYTDSFDSRASTLTDPVEIWRYRDWVVQSLNDDLPYDMFLRYQIAGDLLPRPDGAFNREGLIATGVLAIGNWPQGDADKEKMVCDIVDDQIDLVTRGFMALTVSCARCHDHKFEPFTTEDYYALAGIFFSSSILPGPGKKTEGSPILHLPLASKEELAARTAREERMAALRKTLDEMLQADRAAFAAREVSRASAYLLAALGLDAPAQQGDTGMLDPAAVRKWQVWLGLRPGTLDQLTRDVHGIPGLHARKGIEEMPSAVVNLSGADQHYITITQPANSIIVHPGPDQAASVAWRSPIHGSVRVEATLSDADATCGDGFLYRLVHGEGTGRRILVEGAVDNGKAGQIQGPIEAAVREGDLLRLEIDPRGDYACDSTLITWSLRDSTGERWDFTEELRGQFTLSGPWPDHAGRPEVWYLLDPNQAPPDAGLRKELRPLLEAWQGDAHTAPALRDFADALGDRLAAEAGQTAAAPLREELSGAGGPFWLSAPPAAADSPRIAMEEELRQLEQQPPPPLELAVGIQEGAVPDTAYTGTMDVRIHRRGDYNNLGEVVPRGMPEVLRAVNPPPPITTGSGRRELADWVASPKNPLTARVMVNRIWQHHFGAGLVRTPGDFGLRGEAPTHPELLDYLASAFVQSGWSIKAMHRLMLNTATYQQAATGNPDSLRRDPENRFLARMNRRRIEAEALRDSLLAVSGQLDLRPGGPAYADLMTPRRSLYLKTNRSDRTTFAMLFDAADPTAIIPARVEATVAPQALFLMNHPFVRQAAAALAAEALRPDHDLGTAIEALYQRLYARPATPREKDLAAAYLNPGHPDFAAEARDYCHALLCANEFMFLD